MPLQTLREKAEKSDERKVFEKKRKECGEEKSLQDVVEKKKKNFFRDINA